MTEVSRLTDEEVIRSFSCYHGAGDPEHVIDFLGTRTRTRYVSSLRGSGGTVEGYPIPANFHATQLEWAGSLRAVVAARDEFVMVELGAGWAPWMASLAFAARQRGIPRCRLLGIEGCREHCDFARTHLQENGLPADEFSILHGIVGPRDGVAEFSVLPDASADYGAAAHFPGVPSPAAGPAPSLYRRLGRRAKRLLRRFGLIAPHPSAQPAGPPGPPRRELLSCYSLATLLAPYRHVDLIHVDVQGHECEVLAGAVPTLCQKAKWLVIGTHGRLIEERLLRDVASWGWSLQGSEACRYLQMGPDRVLERDGCQVWYNPALVAASRAA